MDGMHVLGVRRTGERAAGPRGMTRRRERRHPGRGVLFGRDRVRRRRGLLQRLEDGDAGGALERDGWTVQTTPNRADAEDSYLVAVDCNSATSCTATGSVFHGGTVKTITLAERWDGTTWHLSAPGAPAAATQSNLTGVSCQTSTNCMGVGWYYDSSGNEFPLFAPYN
jgi:hypothetical protein